MRSWKGCNPTRWLPVLVVAGVLALAFFVPPGSYKGSQAEARSCSYFVVRGTPYYLGAMRGKRVSRCLAISVARRFLRYGDRTSRGFRCRRGRHSPVTCRNSRTSFYFYTETE